MNKRVNKYMRMAAVFALCSAMTSCNTVKPSTSSDSISAASQTVLSGEYERLPEPEPDDTDID